MCKGDEVELSKDRMRVHVGPGWVRATHGVPRGVSYRWSIKLPDASGFCALGVVTEDFQTWNGIVDDDEPEAYFVTSNGMALNGKRVKPSTRKVRFSTGDLVDLELDRSNGKTVLVTSVNGRHTAQASLPHAERLYFPAVYVSHDKFVCRAFFLPEPRLVFWVSDGSSDGE